jgi:hypothetical protein
MSEYINFVDDFPRRCKEVLRFAEGFAQIEEREVTLYLMVASAGFLVPYERLKPDPEPGPKGGSGIPHPSRDNETFYDAAQQLKNDLDKPFLDSVGLGQGPSSWYSGKVRSVEGGPSDWRGFRERVPITKSLKLSAFLSVIRNALAHGSIYTFKNPIEEIIFIKPNKTNNDWSFVSVSPVDFRQFLDQWFNYLDGIHISYEETSGVLRDAT